MTAARRTATAPRTARNAPPGRNRVRIVGGAWRSRLVRFPPAAELRPTPDRVRETLFNWLGQRLDGLAALDLFAGSGALGFEALSRGASRAVLVERDRHVAAALRAAARELGAAGAQIVEGDALAYLARTSERFDVVFVDPPYASGLAARALAALPGRLNPRGRVYVESAEPIEPCPPWHALREGRAGAVRYALFGLTP
ncbi:MAG TPA: 16S rRNA (guanine(966)-N(2))-methyltransferase RsmD [Usitatibacter sp.]|nr:16S rRNA (guanine(966)-N(2))-methyltransferase RsmD [Usitatibacter sp.]